VPQAYFVDSANTLKTEAYALLGLKLGFDNGGPISAYIEGRNLPTRPTFQAPASSIRRPPRHHCSNRATDGQFMPG
jgi:iron complex outermembrane receptor protein